MTEKEHQIVYCPVCNFSYRVPKALLGRDLPCKQCGAVFPLAPVKGADEKEHPCEPAEAQGIDCNDGTLLIGKLAVKYMFASREQVMEVVLEQAKMVKEGQSVPLGQLLLHRGVINENQLNFLLSVQSLIQTRQADLRFGRLAVENQFATQDDVNHALEQQKRIFKKKKVVVSIGELLVRSGTMTPQQRDSILRRQEALHQEQVEGESEAVAPPRVSREGPPFRLEVSEDRLTALLVPREDEGLPPIPVTLADVKAFLRSHGIVHGIIEDFLIQRYLESQFGEGKHLLVAQGTPPEEAGERGIRFYFDRPQPGDDTKGSEGRPDFSRVKRGDVLAEYFPEEGEVGMDVFGNPIPPPMPESPPFRAGPGVSLSREALKVIAEVDGRPVIQADGCISVLPLLEIDGDVDIKRGNIEFEGDIRVSGSVQNGLQVKGVKIFAGEILRAEIESQEDVVVSGGIIGTRMKAGGLVSSTFVRDAQIEAGGDVVIEKEIIDSRIETSGSLSIPEGVVFSSMISAKKGIRAGQIGSEKTKPCTLIVGEDMRIRKAIESLREELAAKEEKIREIRLRLEKIKKESDKAQEELGNLAQEQDRDRMTLKQLQEKMQEPEAAGDEEQRLRIEATMKALQERIEGREKDLEGLFEEQDRLSGEKSDLEKKAVPVEEEIRGIQDKIAELNARRQAEKGVPEVRVTGSIFRDTTVKGINASLTLPDRHENVLIKEVKTRGVGDKIEWKIRLTRPI